MYANIDGTVHNGGIHRPKKSYLDPRDFTRYDFFGQWIYITVKYRENFAEKTTF